MSDEKLHGGSEGQDMDTKPFFTVSDSKTFTNLHKLAQKRAVEKIGSQAAKKDRDINKILINTCMSQDGKFMEGAKKGVYDVCLIFQIYNIEGFKTDLGKDYDTGKDMEAGENDPDQQSLDNSQKDVEDFIKPIAENANKALQEYFAVFANLKEIPKAKMFFPSFKDGEMQFKNSQAVEISQKKWVEQWANYRNDKEEMTKVGDFVPRIGFKVQYKLFP